MTAAAAKKHQAACQQHQQQQQVYRQWEAGATSTVAPGQDAKPDVAGAAAAGKRWATGCAEWALNILQQLAAARGNRQEILLHVTSCTTLHVLQQLLLLPGTHL